MTHIHDPKHRAFSFTKARRVVIHIFTDISYPRIYRNGHLCSPSKRATSATYFTDKTAILGSITVVSLTICKIQGVL